VGRNKRKKNRSRCIKDGTILQTRDDYLDSGKNYQGKPGYPKKALYRPVAVVASNRNDELAIVKITSNSKAKKLPDGLRGRPAWFRPIVETKDNEGKPIKRGFKFWPNRSQEKLSTDNLRKVQRTSFRGNRKQNQDNRKKIRTMKGKKPKRPFWKRPPRKRK